MTNKVIALHDLFTTEFTAFDLELSGKILDLIYI